MKSKLKKIIPEKIYYKYLSFKFSKNRKVDIDKIKKKTNKEYNQIFKKNLDWINPQTYTEKMNISKILYVTEEKTRLTDKVLVREWIKNSIGEKYLVPILGIYKSFNEINFDDLPDKFVIKCNHDSGSTFVCNNKEELNLKRLKNKYNFFLKRDYSKVTNEMHYHNIEPKIIIEKYMGENINDYKFLCFNGKPYYCWVDFDRFTNHKRNIYDLNWNLQPFNQENYENYKGNLKKPSNFDEMIKITEKLCKSFDQVRVDLYNVNGRIYFGEMTFTNGSGLEPILPNEYDYKLGELWNLNINVE